MKQKYVMQVNHHMQDHLPVISGVLTAFMVMVLKNIQTVGEILLDHQVLAQINLAQTLEVFFYSAIGGAAGWVARELCTWLYPIIQTAVKQIRHHYKEKERHK